MNAAFGRRPDDFLAPPLALFAPPRALLALLAPPARRVLFALRALFALFELRELFALLAVAALFALFALLAIKSPWRRRPVTPRAFHRDAAMVTRFSCNLAGGICTFCRSAGERARRCGDEQQDARGAQGGRRLR
jgi:hypothetical protein